MSDGGLRAALLSVFTLWERELLRFVRQRSRLVGAGLQPLLFWALMGSGFQASFRAAGAPGAIGYAEYAYPGILAMVLLFTAIFATISVVEDRQAGFLQGVLVAPLSRGTIVLGQALGCTTLALLQGGLLLLLAPLAGIRLTLSAAVATLLVMAVVAFGLAALGLCLAWRLDSPQGFHAVMNLVLLPMWALSGAFFPSQGAPIWLAAVMQANPLTYGLGAIRRALYLGNPAGAGAVPALGPALGVAALFAAVSFAGAVWVATRKGR